MFLPAIVCKDAATYFQCIFSKLLSRHPHHVLVLVSQGSGVHKLHELPECLYQPEFALLFRNPCIVRAGCGGRKSYFILIVVSENYIRGKNKTKLNCHVDYK